MAQERLRSRLVWLGANGGDDVVKEDAARAAHLDRGRAALAAAAVLWGNVHATPLALVVGAEEADEPLLAPVRGPGVAHNPVALAVLLAVANKLHSVVKVGVGLVAAVEDAALVVLPCDGLDADGDGALLGDSIHQRLVLVGGQLGVARHVHNRLRLVELALVKVLARP